ncbi:MAG: carboxypeptidase regulatory-like domain-containing protein [Bryobacteraceae bacterium]
MAWRGINYYSRLFILLSLAVSVAAASQNAGQVTFNGLPVPGATVTAIEDEQKFSTTTDQQGIYSFPDLRDGIWKMQVDMSGFAIERREVVVGPNAPTAQWELKLLSLDQMKAELQPAASATVSTPPAASEPKEPANIQSPAAQTPEDDLSQRAADGFLVNGSMNNGAASPFSQAAAFGNNRNGGKGLYNGGIGVILNNSALDARPFSLTGQDTPKAAYNQLTGVATLGGPMQIPHLFKNGPNFFVGYQWTRNSNANTESALMPDVAQRNGVFSSPIVDPATGAPFPGNVIPQNRISPQAQALLNLYPLPNFAGNTRYNYQIPILSPTHQDALQSRLNKSLGFKDQIYGRFAFQNTRSDASNVFSFLDTTDVLGLNAEVNWVHRLNQRWFLNVGIQFSRLVSRITPYFEDRENVSGQAGIMGNNQDPTNWGPPSLNFSSGIAGLTDAESAYDRNQTSGLSYSMLWNRRAHNITFGTDFRWQQFNYLSQQNPRGTFTFTGGATGSDFADFMVGIPDTSAIAYGNADKYFREPAYDAYITDDWRVGPTFTVNAGVRWEYGAPITEEYNRLVNLDIVPGYTAAAPVVASNPVGPLTGERYPDSLVLPDRRGFQPRIGIAWHPVAGSSLVVRAGYGIYYDTSVYQTIALQMAQQPPLSKASSVQNSEANPLTLANGFNAPSINTFAIDPNFRVGYAQNWQVSVQRDLPGSLQLTGTYLGIKGTHGVQEFLPNTYPLGAAIPCPTCPTGFAYLASNGNSTRETAQVQLRRRLHSGLAATLQYTYSKSIDDDAALGGQGAGAQNSSSPGIVMSGGSAPLNLPIAQNWLDLSAERGLSTFDQRQLLSLQMQYTSGMGLSGGTLFGGRKGALLKDWTVATQITAGTGLPQTPVYLTPVEGTGVTGSIRPDYTGAPLYQAPSGLSLNPAAYAAPLPGQWGNAGRNSITGPNQFTLNASLARTFRVSDRLNLDLRIDAVNALNHVTFTAWNTTINSAQFGLPAAANAMRSLQMTLRLRF